jgi:hypothetical protein
MLDAEKVSADWREVARIVLHIDPEAEADRARRAFDTPLRVQNGLRERAIDNFCAEARCADLGALVGQSTPATQTAQRVLA